jgi:cyclic pyranopterin phosphate synthase
MPRDGVPCISPSRLLTFEEISRLVSIFANAGINKVRITGGEPLVRKGIIELVHSLAGNPGIRTLAMTTNATLLRCNAHALRAAGLTYLNVSLDSLRPQRYAKITRGGKITEALEGIRAALDAGFTHLKINVVVIGGINDDEVLDFVELARLKPIHVRFIEYMPFRSNGWSESAFVPYTEMRRVIEKRFEIISPPSSEGAHTVSKDYLIPGFAGQIGFISSMTDHFCGGCNRLRLLADGGLKTCLFQQPVVNLRRFLRSGAADETIERAVRRSLLAKTKEHPPLEELVGLDGNQMVAIGG